MGRRICASSPAPTSSSSQIPAEPRVPASSHTMPAPISQAMIESISRNYDSSLQQSLKKLHHHSFVITDPHLPGHPIVYASDSFLHMCGYPAEEVLGRNPKFLQGPDTDRQTVCQVRDAVSEGKPCHVLLLNYTKQGWPFHIVLHMAPVFSQNDGRLLHFVGAQSPLFDCFASLKKQAVQSASTLLGCQKGPYTFLGQKGTLSSPNAGGTPFLPYSNGYLQAGSVTGSQKKKKMKVALTILQLVMHELTKSNERKSAEVLSCRYLSENAETALCSSLTLALNRIQQSFVISNTNMPGMPIVYASDMFVRLTGYQKDEVLGRNCRLLQGQDTDSCVVQQIRDSIKAEKACTVRILNYKKDGLPFWNLLHVAPIRDHTGKIAYFVGVQWELGTNCCHTSEIVPVMQQLGAVGAIKVAFRGLGLHRSFGPQKRVC